MYDNFEMPRFERRERQASRMSMTAETLFTRPLFRRSIYGQQLAGASVSGGTSCVASAASAKSHIRVTKACWSPNG